MISYPCPHCRDMLRVDDERAGQAFVCGLCGATSLVPGGALAQATPPTAEPEEAVTATTFVQALGWDFGTQLRRARAKRPWFFWGVIAPFGAFLALMVPVTILALAHEGARSASAPSYDRAAALVSEGRYTEAYPELVRIHDRDGHDVRVVAAIAYCQSQLGEYAQAERNARQVLDQVPSTPTGDRDVQRRAYLVRSMAGQALTAALYGQGKPVEAGVKSISTMGDSVGALSTSLGGPEMPR